MRSGRLSSSPVIRACSSEKAPGLGEQCNAVAKPPERGSVGAPRQSRRDNPSRPEEMSVNDTGATMLIEEMKACMPRS